MDHKNKLKELDIQDALKYAGSIINAVHDPLIILYEDFTVALASLSFYQTFEVKPGETEGQLIYELGNRQWDIPKLKQLLEEILPKTTSFDNFEIEHQFPRIGKRVMLLNARRVYLQANRTKLIIITIKDITELKKIAELQEQVRNLELRLKTNF
ncbi:MAG: PAS domain-containing protein [Candidatus Omnitrophota bacterium]|nr:PAS domain-containing protein [Candidatus Omnitrophota bacterium]MDZ4242663.1 PAS domain-containing protein [Candidatus Omnitrophota bacterium]